MLEKSVFSSQQEVFMNKSNKKIKLKNINQLNLFDSNYILLSQKLLLIIYNNKNYY